jgi:hypothetical protein
MEEFIFAKSTKNTFSLNELLKWCREHLKTSEMDEPLWQDKIEDLLWKLEGANLVKRIASDFSGIPHFCRISPLHAPFIF